MPFEAVSLSLSHHIPMPCRGRLANFCLLIIFACRPAQQLRPNPRQMPAFGTPQASEDHAWRSAKPWKQSRRVAVKATSHREQTLESHILAHRKHHSNCSCDPLSQGPRRGASGTQWWAQEPQAVQAANSAHDLLDPKDYRA